MTFSDKVRDSLRKWLLPKLEMGRFNVEIYVDSSDLTRKLAEAERTVDRIASKYAAIGNVPPPRPAVLTGSEDIGGLTFSQVTALMFFLGFVGGAVVLAFVWPFLRGG